MELYHYTSVPLLHSILNEGISKGHFLLSNNQMLHGHCWYTSSPLPYGHGLPDGTEVLTQSEKEFAYRAAGDMPPTSAKSLQNKRLVRIKVDYEWLRSQDSFYKFSKLLQLYGESSLYGKMLGVTGWIKPETLSDPELRRWAKSPKLKNDTWFVHNGVLPAERIISVEYMQMQDIYVPYDFEKHGRPELERYGIFSISKAELEDLNLKELNAPFLNGSIVVCCPHPNAPPVVVFRKRDSKLVLKIENGEFLGREGCLFTDGDTKRLSAWTSGNAGNLMILWNKSKESWFRYND